jgi:hypothetical protein
LENIENGNIDNNINKKWENIKTIIKENCTTANRKGGKHRNIKE